MCYVGLLLHQDIVAVAPAMFLSHCALEFGPARKDDEGIDKPANLLAI